MIPHIEKKNDQKILYVNEEPFIMLSGEVHNSSSSSAEYMKSIWEKAVYLNLNSLLLAVSWEMIEPVEGEFNFEIVDALIMQARKYNMKIGFLWFGAWKNAQCYYAPEWVKKDLTRFKRAQVVKGYNGMKLEKFHGLYYTTLSAFCHETREADANAFAKLMAHIRDIDSENNTVIVVQVENETGIMGCAREYGAEADELFTKPVPEKLVEHLKSNFDTLHDTLKREFNKKCNVGDNWSQVFGKMAEEVFTAYYTADYVNYVAKAGKDEYPLPMLVNCWLDKEQEPGYYPSGGPVAKLMDIWCLTAENIDVIAPDIYVPYFCKVCAEYNTKGNPIFIAECATHSYAAAREIYTVGKHHAMCYAPFGIEDIGQPFTAMQGRLFGMDTEDEMLKTPQDIEEYANVNHILREMMPIIGKCYGTDNLQGTSSEECARKCFDMYPYKIIADFTSSYSQKKNGACMVVRIAEDEFYIVASGCVIQMDSCDETRPNVDIISLEDGTMSCGEFKPYRRLNGDEIAVIIMDEVELIHVKLFAYGNNLEH